MKKEIKNSSLYIDNVKVEDIAKKFGTPLYVYSYNSIVAEINSLKKDFEQKYENVRIAYASKAFNCIAMCQILKKHSLCLDVVSGGELYTAIKANFPAEHIEFNGNNKSTEELEMAIDYGVGRIIIDGLFEIDIIEEICKAKNKKVNVLFRINPGVDSHTNEKMSTGKIDSKFGIPTDEDVFFPLVQKALKSEYINFLGLHFHVGSQLFDNSSHILATDVILELAEKIREKFDFELKEINLGGGFGVVYTDEKKMPYSYFLDPLMEKIEQYYKGKKRPAVVIEPGRSLIGESGFQLYKVGQIKDIKDVRKYVSVDGGMTDNIRPTLYDAKYSAMIVNKADKVKEESVTICGKCCESGDILIKDISLPKIEKDDIIAIFTTGAYGYAMANNYNKIAKAGVVMIKDNDVFEIIRRQSYDDIIKNEVKINL